MTHLELRKLIRAEARKIVNEGIDFESQTNKEAKLMYRAIKEAIADINPDFNITELASAVALVLYDEYGRHNYDAFMKHLKSKLEDLHKQ